MTLRLLISFLVVSTGIVFGACDSKNGSLSKDAAIDTDSDTDADTGANIDTDTDSDTDENVDSGIGSETDSETDSDTDSFPKEERNIIINNTSDHMLYISPYFEVIHFGIEVSLDEPGCACRCDSCESCTEPCTAELSPIVSLASGQSATFLFDNEMWIEVDVCPCGDDPFCGNKCFTSFSMSGENEIGVKFYVSAVSPILNTELAEPIAELTADFYFPDDFPVVISY